MQSWKLNEAHDSRLDCKPKVKYLGFAIKSIRRKINKILY